MLKAHTSTVRSVAFSNDGRMLLSASDDKTVKVGMAHALPAKASAAARVVSMQKGMHAPHL